MRLLVCGINFAPELTGVGKYTGEMVEWLVSRGHEVRVVCAPPYYPEWRVTAGYKSTWYARELWRGAQLWRCPLWVPRDPGGGKRLLHLLSFAFSSLPVMLRQVWWRPQVALAVEPTLFSAPATWLAARLCGARAWLHVQDFELDAAFELGLLQSPAARRLATRLERWLMRRFDVVSTISRRMVDRAEAKGVPASSLVYFPNWVDLRSIMQTKGPNALRVELGIAENTMVALYSGTISKKQGLDLLVDSATLLRDMTSLVFVFCGSGPGRAELEQKCQGLPNVRFLDLQPIERLGTLLGMADIHLLPQRADAADLVMPSKLTGILASGAPVVASCDPDTALGEVTGVCGLISPPEDGAAFATAIRLLAGDQDLRSHLGSAGRTYAEAHLSCDRVLAQFEAELMSAAKCTGPE
jgi:colanic acid biosynthesis glycosyl transferase WcaI